VPARPRGRWWPRRLLLLGLLAALLVDQAVQWTVLRDGWLFGDRIAPFDPPLFNEAQVEARERLAALARGEAGPPRSVVLDGELGWAPRPDTAVGPYRYDACGARVGTAGPLARERQPGVRRIVAVGCSFTHGDEVPGDATWCSRLDEARPDVEVANLGVGGYGADQALLRLRRDGLSLRPDEVWFGWLPAASLRVTELYRPALRHLDTAVGFKPRFVLDGDTLRLVPCPARDPATALALLSDQQAFLSAVGEADFWVRRCPSAYAPFLGHASHVSALARLLLTRFESGGRRAADWLARPDGEPRRVLLAVVSALRDESEAAGARFRLLVLPDQDGLAEAARPDGPSWSGCLDELRARGVDVLDLAPALLAAGALRDGTLWQAGGHYGPVLHAAVAEALAEALDGP